MSVIEVKTCIEDITEFLDNVLARDRFHLYAINPQNEGKGVARGFVAEGVDEALRWIEEQQDKQLNIYYALNTPGDNQHKKAKKHELKWLYGVHVDIDLPKDMKRQSEDADRFIDTAARQLKKFDIARPHIIMSGNGVQGVWLFEKPLRATEDNANLCEAICLKLRDAFGAPAGTHNVDRILRVPGTVNFPGRTKRAKGYRPVLAQLAYVSRDTVTIRDFDGLERAAPAPARQVKRVDYTKKSYSSHWKEPLSWEEFKEFQPDIEHLMRESLRNCKGDRSAAAYALLHSVLEFIMFDTRVSARELVDDYDAYKNISEICLEAAEDDDCPSVQEIMGHYTEADSPGAQLGYEIPRMLHTAADADKRVTSMREIAVERRKEVATIERSPISDITSLEAARAFIDYVYGAVGGKEKLPSAEGHGDNVNAKQLPTGVNIQHILEAARITPRLNFMTDEISFHVHPDAGKNEREGLPAEHFERAMADSQYDMRSKEEFSLMFDAVTRFGITAREDVFSAFRRLAYRNRYHPLIEYCTSRAWDGHDRISKVAACLDTEHELRDVYIKMFFYQCIGAIKSMQNFFTECEGLQISGVVILVGTQGIGKSTFWSRVTPRGYMAATSTLGNGTGKEIDFKRGCLSRLVCALDEIGSSFRRSDQEALKNFISSAQDEWRVPYDKGLTTRPRMTVFVGTSNDLQLADQTGSRRYLPLVVDSIDLKRLADIDLQQVYAQAWQAVMEDGEDWWLTPEQETTRDEYNERHRLITEEESALEDYFAHLTKQHTYEWLSYSQICKLLSMRCVLSNAKTMREFLAKKGCKYQETRREKGTVRKRVWHFPILPERYLELTRR
jgi:hypothetical protein